MSDSAFGDGSDGVAMIGGSRPEPDPRFTVNAVRTMCFSALTISQDAVLDAGCNDVLVDGTLCLYGVVRASCVAAHRIVGDGRIELVWPRRTLVVKEGLHHPTFEVIVDGES